MTPQEALESFVRARRATSRYAGVWDEDVWELKVRATASNPYDKRVWFLTRPICDADPIPFKAPFADFARAVVVHYGNRQTEPRTLSPYKTRVTALRFLYDAMGPGASDPASLTGATFQGAYERARLELAATTANRIGSVLAEIARIVVSYRLARNAIKWEWERQTEHKEEGEHSRGLLTLAQLNAVALISNTYYHQLSPSDRLKVCAVDLMATLGFRIGEVITLPRDTLYEEPRFAGDGKPLLDGNGRLGLRYWAEKRGGSVFLLKAVPTALAPVVRRAVERAIELSKPAWRVADHLREFERPTLGQRLDRLPDDARLHDLEIERALGLAPVAGPPGEAGRCFVRANHLPFTAEIDESGMKRYLVRKDGLLALLRSRSEDRVFREDIDGGVSLADLLFIEPYRGLGGTARGLSTQSLSGFLGCRPMAMKSIFDRLSFEEDGRPIAIQSHAFRISLATLAMRCGLSEIKLARWQGRVRVRENKAYDRRTRGEKAAAVAKPLVAAGRMAPPTLAPLPAWPAGEPLAKKGFTAHVTSLGVCRHPYARAPCGRHAAMVEGMLSGSPSLLDVHAGAGMAAATDTVHAAALDAQGRRHVGAPAYVEAHRKAAEAFAAAESRAWSPAPSQGEPS